MTCRIAIDARRDVDDAILARIERDRKVTFIDRMGWDLKAVDGRERDQFDTPDSLVLRAGDPLIFSMRINPAERSMVRELWPDFTVNLDAGSFELSRWISHGKGSLKDTRGAVAAMIAEFRARQWLDLFSVATDRIVAAHKVFGMNPTEEFRIGDDVNLCKWRL